MNDGFAQENVPFKLSQRKVKAGEWVDIRDLAGKWAEGQVLAAYNEYLKVHYNGWPHRMDEWLPMSS